MTNLRQAYDLWRHNCNNFSNDFATFLLGKGIPDRITNLPQQVLDTPFGRMLQPMMDDMVRKSKAKKQGMLGLADNAPATNVPQTSHQHAMAVRSPKNLDELKALLASAEKSCAVIFFTSQSCAPCRPLYPVYQQLAVDTADRAIIIKVDIGVAFDIAKAYEIRATPTFVTFLNGEQENRWSGSDPNMLRQNIQTLVQMAWPPHLHQNLRLPGLRGANTKPVLYSKVPPLEKLMLKIGDKAQDPAVQGVKIFISNKATGGDAEATLPDLDSFSLFLRRAIQDMTPEVLFAVVDLLRVAMSDVRFSGYYAEEKDHKTIGPILEYVNNLTDCPYSLRLVALQTACNLFSSPLYIHHLLCCPTLTAPLVQLITTSLLDDKHHNVRVAASSLAFNIATSNSKYRIDEHRIGLPEGDQVELAASLLEAIAVEEGSPEALKGFLLAFGYLVYCAPKDGELVDMIKSMDAQGTVLGKAKLFPQEGLVMELGKELLGKGL